MTDIYKITITYDADCNLGDVSFDKSYISTPKYMKESVLEYAIAALESELEEIQSAKK